MKNTGFKKVIKSKTALLILVIVVVVVFFDIVNPNYLSGDNIKNILVTSSLSGTLAVGIGCILISGNTDLSAGGVGALGGVLVSMLCNVGMPWVLALLITLAFGIAAGLLNAFLVNKCNIAPFLATLATASIWKGLAMAWTNAVGVAIANEKFYKLGLSKLFGFIPMPFVYIVILFIIYGFILNKTKFGRQIYMIGGNRQAARLAGVSSAKVTTILMMNCSMLSAFAGAVLAARMHVGAPGSVVGTELTAITASCLGGIAFGGGSGGMLNGFIGVMLLTAFNIGLSVIGLDTYWQTVASGVLLIIALVIDYMNQKSIQKSLSDIA